LNDENKSGWAPWDRPEDESLDGSDHQAEEQDDEDGKLAVYFHDEQTLTLTTVLAYESDEVQHPSSDPFEPTNYNGFKKMSDKVKRHEVERTGQLSPTTERLLKGCKQLILAGDLIAQNAHDNSPIIAERRKRQAMANRVIQTGGVITIEDAKRMKRVREEIEAEKEEKAEKRRQARRDKLIAVDNKKRKKQGLPAIPDHIDPALNPDYIHWKTLQQSSHYEEWYETNAKRLQSTPEGVDEASRASDWDLEDAIEDDWDELGLGAGDEEADPFM
jgi:hypothetical protein